MLLPVGKMKQGDTMPVSFSEPFLIPAVYGLKREETLVSVDGVLKKEGDYFSFTGELRATLEADCGRCLAPVLETLCVPADDKFSETMDTLGTEEVWQMHSKNIDLSESILSGLLMAIPGRFICSEGCKGLCPHCGADLNKTACGCRNEEIDERFAKLKDIFSD